LSKVAQFRRFLFTFKRHLTLSARWSYTSRTGPPGPPSRKGYCNMTTSTPQLFYDAALNVLSLSNPERPFNEGPTTIERLLPSSRACLILFTIAKATGLGFGDTPDVVPQLTDQTSRIGQVFHHSYQPYDDVKFIIESVEPVTAGPDSPSWMKVRAQGGWLRLRGTVVQGRRTSRLFQHSSTQPITGTYVLEVKPEELTNLRRVDVACG
jgi:hypothetical protein